MHVGRSQFVTRCGAVLGAVAAAGRLSNLADSLSFATHAVESDGFLVRRRSFVGKISARLRSSVQRWQAPPYSEGYPELNRVDPLSLDIPLEEKVSQGSWIKISLWGLSVSVLLAAAFAANVQWGIATFAVIVLQSLSSAPMNFIVWYEAVAAANPLVTKACTSGVCYFIGDVVAQVLEGRRRWKLLDKRRAMRNSMAGWPRPPLWSHICRLAQRRFSVIVGRLLQATRDALFLVADEEKTHSACPVALDQTIFALSLNTAYTWLLGTLAREPAAKVRHRIRITLVPALLYSWRFWPLVHLVSYSPFITTDLKLLWIDVMEVIWVAILSTLANGKKASKEKVQIDAVSSA